MKYIKIVLVAVLFYTTHLVAQKVTKPNILFIAILNNYCQQAVCGTTRASL